jgi:hypothetical protein
VQRDKNFYKNLVAHDVITLMRPLLQQAGFRLRDVDGKIEPTYTTITWDTPWVHIRHNPWMDCYLWHKIIFDVVQKMSGQAWPPSDCQSCFKVVVRPKTIVQLFALYDLECSLNLPSKCGIETRDKVHGLYGGYFYNRGLTSGLTCYQLIRKTVDEWPGLGPDVKVILKRACTEYEHECGPSDKWTITQDQLYIEGLIKALVVSDNALRRQPEHLVYNVQRKWIEWAYAHGDATYQEYHDGPLVPDYVTYQGLAKKEGWQETAKKVDSGLIDLPTALNIGSVDVVSSPSQGKTNEPTIVEDPDYRLPWDEWKKKNNYRQGTKHRRCFLCIESRKTNDGKISCIAHEESPVVRRHHVCDKWS